MKPKFEFYEIVRVGGRDCPPPLVGMQGAIVGRSQAEDGQWFYSVSFDELDKSWFLSESTLEATGIYRKRSDYYSGERLQVLVDPKTGEGKIANKS